MLRNLMTRTSAPLLRSASSTWQTVETSTDPAKLMLLNSVGLQSNHEVTTKRGSRLIRRKITRLETDYEIDEEELSKVQRTANEHYQTKLVNRNPRNLEQLLFEPKPLGWELEATSRSFWNRVSISTSGKYITAKVEHNSGRPLITISTADSSFRQFFLNKNDVEAAEKLGLILARRCLESGINYVFSSFKEDEYKSKKVQSFVNALRSNGLVLKEPEFIFPRRSRDL